MTPGTWPSCQIAWSRVFLDEDAVESGKAEVYLVLNMLGENGTMHTCCVALKVRKSKTPGSAGDFSLQLPKETSISIATTQVKKERIVFHHRSTEWRRRL